MFQVPSRPQSLSDTLLTLFGCNFTSYYFNESYEELAFEGTFDTLGSWEVWELAIQKIDTAVVDNLGCGNMYCTVSLTLFMGKGLSDNTFEC